MTITFLQPDGVPITAQQARQGWSALYGAGSGRPLGGLSGLRVGTAADTLTATSTTWTLKPCSAMIDPGAATHQGMYGWASDANITGSVTAADATVARKDIVYIQVNDSSSGDGSGELTANVKYLAGPTDGSNAAPSLPARSFLLGTISVPKATTGSPTVTLNPARFVAAGGTRSVGSQAERDALIPFEGMKIVRADLAGTDEVYTGGAWVGSGSTAITTFGSGWTALTGAHQPRVYRSGAMVHLIGGLSIGSTGNVSNMLTVPAAFRPANANTTFVGSGVSSSGAVYELALSNGVLTVPAGYLTGSITVGVVVPVKASWPLY